ncbi:MAG: SRPBCC domain-containing protein [Bacteroidota bacterium]
MSHLKTEIILNASTEKVWKTLTDLPNYQHWNPFIISSEGEPVVGNRITNKMVLNGKVNVFMPTITKAEPQKELEWLGKGMMGMFKGRHYFKLEDLGDDQTKLIHGEMFSGLLSGLIMRMIGDETLKSFEKMNHALKKEVDR